ncbi:unnamed protein product [Closterium sp. NIES-64]|nr:unnamed protein product [Closterium sp. NIES-64]
MPFGQIVIGPPGSGKTTYCNGMQQFMQLLGRKVAVVNMDPANDRLPYECAVDVEELVRLEDVMGQHGLFCAVNVEELVCLEDVMGQHGVFVRLNSTPFPFSILALPLFNPRPSPFQSSPFPFSTLALPLPFPVPPPLPCPPDRAGMSVQYECAVNVEELVRLEDVMGQHGLGPNGGLVYCMDYIDKNLDWLQSKLKPFLRRLVYCMDYIDKNFDWLQSKLKPLEKDHYFLFDFPGQVELFTLHASAQSIIKRLTDKMHYRVSVVVNGVGHQIYPFTRMAHKAPRNSPCSLFTLHGSAQSIIKRLTDKMHYRVSLVYGWGVRQAGRQAAVELSGL